jgi:hypothetical protein
MQGIPMTKIAPCNSQTPEQELAAPAKRTKGWGRF